MQLPQWLTIAVAGLVILFGIHRLRISFRPQVDEDKAVARGGLYGMRRRTHRLIGVVYLLLGAGLVATSFGWSPLSSLFAPTTKTAPTTPGILLPLVPATPGAAGADSN